MKTKGGGKRKGGLFERECCRTLSLWITNGKRHDCFWRSAMSGGRATLLGLAVRQAGDIAAVSTEGLPFTDRWFVECKHVRNLMLDRFCIEHSGTLWKFWEVACREAERHVKKPMLIARQNGWPALVLVRKADLPESINLKVLVCRVNDTVIIPLSLLIKTRSKLWIKKSTYGWIQSRSAERS